MSQVLVNLLPWITGPCSLVVKSQQIQVFGNDLDSELVSNCSLGRVGESSLVLSQQLVNKKSAQIFATADITMVHINRTTGKSTPFPKQLKEKLLSKVTHAFHSNVPSPFNFSQSYVSFLLTQKQQPSGSILEEFSHVYTVYQSHLDWWSHTNHSSVIQFYEDTLFMGGTETGFKNPHNRQMSHLLTSGDLTPFTIKVEYVNQSFAGQTIEVKLWPLFLQDSKKPKGSKFDVVQNFPLEETLIQDCIGFGGEITCCKSKNTISRAIILPQKFKSNL
eukprot:TRINITY_DN4021_c0_g1_i1.p1 TRINITY_DN4021_c0_g1~~TRINITY_DN4021_c0_g1_i1.p1  ORF type:complete len:287 (+),score=48.12 TRINITY_DN4021_c0_g1_i1:34-861(+)